MTLKDEKESLHSFRKPDITHFRKVLAVYAARACEYGSEKYVRANYLRPTEGGIAADFVRYRNYLRACVSHLLSILDDMESHQSMDPDLKDETGMRQAAYSPDLDEVPGGFPASRLPHIAHAAASLVMVLTQATECGLLPRDPGRPWEEDHSNTKYPWRAIVENDGKDHPPRSIV